MKLACHFKFTDVLSLIVTEAFIPHCLMMVGQALFHRRLISGVVANTPLSGVSPSVYLEVLSRIAEETLLYNRPMERITLSYLNMGDPSLGTVWAPLSERTLVSALDAGVEAGHLIKIHSMRDKSVFYGLNLPALIHEVCEVYDDLDGLPEFRKKSIETLRQVVELDGFEYFYHRLVELSAYPVDLKQSEASLALIFRGSDMRLESLAKRLAKKAEMTKGKNAKSADQPLVFEKADGTLAGNGTAGLALWNRELANREDAYFSYQEKSTTQLRTMMARFILDNFEAGNSEDEIRKLISDVVGGWQYVPSTEKVIPSVTKDGKPFRVPLPNTPVFELFYYHMNAIMPLIRRYNSLNCGSSRTDSDQELCGINF